MRQLALEKKVILITGASSGIGRECAIRASQEGARCILVGRDETRLNEALACCAGDGHVVEAIDLSNDNHLESLLNRLPQLDGILQCAGIGDKNTPLKFLSPSFVDDVLGINLRAPILLLAMLDKKKKINRYGSVVMMSSIASFHATPAHSLYCAAKGGLTAFVKGAALDLAGKKIRVNSVAPGMVNTPLIDFSALTEEQKLANEARYPLKRYGEPSDISNMVVFLLSDESAWITGQQFVVDGGFTIGG